MAADSSDKTSGFGLPSSLFNTMLNYLATAATPVSTLGQSQAQIQQQFDIQDLAVKALVALAAAEHASIDSEKPPSWDELYQATYAVHAAFIDVQGSSGSGLVTNLPALQTKLLALATLWNQAP